MRRVGWALPAVVGLVAVSCAATVSDSTITTTTQPPPTLASPTTALAAAAPVATDEEVEAYLMEMSDLDADLEADLRDFECSYNDEFAPGLCENVLSGGFCEADDECEPPPEPSEGELFEYSYGLHLGRFDVLLAHTDVVAGVEPPPGFAVDHQAYVDALRAVYTYIRDSVAAVTNLEELQDVLGWFLDPLAAFPAELGQLLQEAVDACTDLEQQSADAGYRTDLGCPALPAEKVPVAVEVGGAWSAEPSAAPAGGAVVLLHITNTGTEPVRLVAIEIFGGDPTNLPVINGVVDISKSGVALDASSDASTFGVFYPDIFTGEDSQLRDDLPQLLPGESIDVPYLGDGPIVIFDYATGEFEAGRYVVIERL